MKKRAFLPAAMLVSALAAPLQAGDYDDLLAAIARTMPEKRIVGVFYDAKSTLLNVLDFEGSAYQQYGISIKLIPVDAKVSNPFKFVRDTVNRHQIQAILALDGDPVVRPGTPIGIALTTMGKQAPLVANTPEWFQHGALFVIGPRTNGLQINEKLAEKGILEALRKLKAEKPAN